MINHEKIVIFGATRNLGAYTAMHLKNTEYEIIAVGHRKSDNGFYEENGMQYYSVDITLQDELKTFDYLLKYKLFPKIKYINLLYNILGLRYTAKLLNIYRKKLAKSHKN